MGVAYSLSGFARLKDEEGVDSVDVDRGVCGEVRGEAAMIFSGFAELNDEEEVDSISIS